MRIKLQEVRSIVRRALLSESSDGVILELARDVLVRGNRESYPVLRDALEESREIVIGPKDTFLQALLKILRGIGALEERDAGGMVVGQIPAGFDFKRLTIGSGSIQRINFEDGIDVLKDSSVAQTWDPRPNYGIGALQRQNDMSRLEICITNWVNKPDIIFDGTGFRFEEDGVTLDQPVEGADAEEAKQMLEFFWSSMDRFEKCVDNMKKGMAF